MCCTAGFDQRDWSWVAWKSKVDDFEECVEGDSGRRLWVTLTMVIDGSFRAFVDVGEAVCFGRIVLKD